MTNIKLLKPVQVTAQKYISVRRTIRFLLLYKLKAA